MGAAGSENAGRARVWDIVVRLLHWGLAAIVLFNLVRDDGDRIHRWAGYTACGIVAARLLWSAFARSPAGFRDLLPSVPRTLDYLRALVRGQPPVSHGHNPLGTWMVWLLWLLVLGLGVSGWISRTDAFWGEEGPIEIHEWLSDALLVCVCLHLAGVLGMSLVHRENLPWTMVTGRKKVPQSR